MAECPGEAYKWRVLAVIHDRRKEGRRAMRLHDAMVGRTVQRMFGASFVRSMSQLRNSWAISPRRLVPMQASAKVKVEADK